jgi:hypothetical protein
MIAVETLPSMTELMDRQKIVGWIVRDGITNQGIAFTEAARRWPISLPTLNRLMSTGSVGMRFLRLAEKNLDLPHKFLDLVLDGDVQAIAELDDLDRGLRDYVIKELGGTTPSRPRRKARQLGT